MSEGNEERKAKLLAAAREIDLARRLEFRRNLRSGGITAVLIIAVVSLALYVGTTPSAIVWLRFKQIFGLG